MDVFDAMLNNCMWSDNCRSYITSARVDRNKDTLCLEVVYDDSWEESWWKTHRVRTTPPHEHHVFLRDGQVYKIPIHLSNLFNITGYCTTIRKVRNLHTVEFSLGVVAEYRDHMCWCIWTLVQVIPRDVAREIVILCCEVFRSCDYEKYAVHYV